MSYTPVQQGNQVLVYQDDKLRYTWDERNARELAIALNTHFARTARTQDYPSNSVQLPADVEN